MSQILSIAQQYGFGIPFIIVISIVVFIHEFGHYWVARRCGIRVVSFSIGFGKPLFGWTDKHGTRWQVAMLPLGGYVKMFGDTNPASVPDASAKEMTDEEKKVSFYYQSVNKRIAVVFAGPLFNYLLAIVLLSTLFMLQGQPYAPAIASKVIENGAAAHAGLQPGDKIIAIDGESVSRFDDISRIVSLNTGTPISVTFERDNAPHTVTMTPEITVQKDHFGNEHPTGRIGVGSMNYEYEKLPPLTALGHAVTNVWTISTGTLHAIGQMITGARGSDEIGGPLSIAKMAGQSAHEGVWPMILLMAIISINLGMVNLFPIPLLDGGHLLFYGVEKVLGRPLKDETQEAGFRVGLALVGSLMLFATWNDLVHMGVISSIKSLFS